MAGIAQRTAHEYDISLERSSETIRTCRVLCIFCMVYVHVHLFEHAAFQNTPYFLVTRSLFVELFGRSSVPLLSVISGALMVGVIRRRPLTKVLRGRARTLLLPLATWNLIGIAASVAVGHELHVDYLNALIALKGKAFLEPLTFLRDIFVVSTVTPVVIHLSRRFPWLLLMGTVALTHSIELSPIVLRNQILLYYVVGVYVGVYRVEDRVKPRSLAIFAGISIGFLSALAIALPFAPGLSELYHAQLFENLIRRPICALSFWFAATSISRVNPLRRLIHEYLEPAIFLMFLSHILVIQVLGSAYARWGPKGALSYYLAWLILPPLCLATSVAIRRILDHLPSVLSLLLVGRPPLRFGTRPPPAPQPQPGHQSNKGLRLRKPAPE